MDENLLFRALVQGLLGVRPKRSMRALQFITGGGGFWSNPATLLTAAGLAWGVFDTLNQNAGAAGAAGAGSTGSTGSTGSGGSPQADVVPPPIPGAAGGSPAGPVADDVLRMMRLAISAAHADGTVGEHERAAILQQAQAAGVADLVDRELGDPKPLKEIVAGVSDPAHRATLYVLGFTIVRADEQVSGAERIYLAQLANLLGLDAQTVAALEKDTGERIDALGDQGQLGG